MLVGWSNKFKQLAFNSWLDLSFVLHMDPTLPYLNNNLAYISLYLIKDLVHVFAMRH